MVPYRFSGTDFRRRFLVSVSWDSVTSSLLFISLFDDVSHFYVDFSPVICTVERHRLAGDGPVRSVDRVGSAAVEMPPPHPSPPGPPPGPPPPSGTCLPPAPSQPGREALLASIERKPQLKKVDRSQINDRSAPLLDVTGTAWMRVGHFPFGTISPEHSPPGKFPSPSRTLTPTVKAKL